MAPALKIFVKATNDYNTRVNPLERTELVSITERESDKKNLQ